MKIYIIGNGFDLAHNLQTGYWSFREFLNKRHSNFLQDFEKHYFIYPNDSKEYKEKMLWKNFEANLANIDEDIIIDDALSIELYLENGDIGIYDTLYNYFSNEYDYINNLSIYLKEWIKGIKINKVDKKTTHINNLEQAYFISFNYTLILEKIYNISSEKIIHIHGSINDEDTDPIIGHTNIEACNKISERIENSQKTFDEKLQSISQVISDYYHKTLKKVDVYSHKLYHLFDKDIDEIIVIGHSLSEVDLYYYKILETNFNNVKWTIYYFLPTERNDFKHKLLNIGIDEDKIFLKPSEEFFDIMDV